MVATGITIAWFNADLRFPTSGCLVHTRHGGTGKQVFGDVVAHSMEITREN